MRLFKPNVEKMLKKKNASGLIKALSDEESNVRLEAKEALSALGKLKDNQAVDLLIAALGNANKNVRHTSVEILGEIRDIKSVEPLIAMLRDSHWSVRFSTSLALSQFDDGRIVKPLIDSLVENPADTACSFLEYFCSDYSHNLGKHLTLEVLLPALKTKDSKKFAVVVRALGKLNDKRASEVIITALMERKSDEFKEQNDYMKIADSLVNLGTNRLPNNIPPLIQIWFAIRKHDWDRVISFGKQAVGPLIECLYNSDEEIEVKSIEILGKLGDREAVERLALRHKSSRESGKFRIANACSLALRNFDIHMM